MLFQSPYGGIGASDERGYTPNESIGGEVSITLRWHRCFRRLLVILRKEHSRKFQSPYGGIGASDIKHNDTYIFCGIKSFNHLTVA